MNQPEPNNGNQWKSKNEFNQALYYYLMRWVMIVIILFVLNIYSIIMFHLKARKNPEETVPAPETDTIFENTYA